ncbi:response regulator [Rhizobium sp. TRM95796]|uniref:response regulator n=1 Tax=Rhizobium sp. TRM95796 TaxID=2979862 RepID=UPI0021E77848|nr:response regulator [Rhizobium sp. TRM95796]MCV3766633.1 response regulator [Rhizobium sp. TRM95796]
MAKVLLIDDDVELTSLLTEYLVEEGFDAHAVHDGRQGVEESLSNQYDIIVLDIMMPKMNGIEVLQRIRRSSDVPVVMLTARGDNVDRITGLNLGADDYVPKPCSPDELVARLRAILRRSRRQTPGDGGSRVVEAGSLVLTPAARHAEWRGQPLELTGAEYSILEVLARNAGQLVSKQDMAKRVFGQPLAPFDRRIDVHVSSIRQKLGIAENGQSWIRTVRGQGYQLVTEG